MKFYRQILYSTILTSSLFSLAVPSELTAMEPEENRSLNKIMVAPKEDAPEQKSAVPSLQTLTSQAIHSGLKENNENRLTCAQNILESFDDLILCQGLLGLQKEAIHTFLQELFPKMGAGAPLKDHSEFLKSKLVGPNPKYIKDFGAYFFDWGLDELAHVWGEMSPYQYLQTSLRDTLKGRKFKLNEVVQQPNLQQYPFISSVHVKMKYENYMNMNLWIEGFKMISAPTVKIKFEDTNYLPTELWEVACKIPNLTALTAWRYKIPDEANKPLTQASNLREIIFYESEITHETLEALALVPKLQTLKLHLMRGFGSDIKGIAKGMNALAQAPHLQELSLKSYGFPCIDEMIQEFVEAQNLRKFTPSDNFTDKGISNVTKIPNLQELNLEMTQVTDEGVKALALAPKLRKLNLANTQVTDEGVKWLAYAPNLQVLKLYGTKVTLEGRKYLQQAFKERGQSVKITDKLF